MEDKIIIEEKDGIKRKYDVLLRMTIKGNDVVTYTDYSKDGDGIICYSSYIDEVGTLKNIDNEEDFELIDMALKSVYESMKLDNK